MARQIVKPPQKALRFRRLHKSGAKDHSPNSKNRSSNVNYSSTDKLTARSSTVNTHGPRKLRNHKRI